MLGSKEKKKKRKYIARIYRKSDGEESASVSRKENLRHIGDPQDQELYKTQNASEETKKKKRKEREEMIQNRLMYRLVGWWFIMPCKRYNLVLIMSIEAICC